MLTLKIGERNIEIVESASFVRGTIGATCKITFEPFWEDYEKTVVFKRLGNGCITPFVIIANSQAETLSIPHEILAESGYFKIGVYGTKDNVVLPTLWSDNIKIEYGTDTYGEAPQPPTPSVYEQILKTSKNAVDTANSVRQDADNGLFNGEKGEKGDKGDKGDNYVLTLEDKQEIANMVGGGTVDQTYDPESENAQSGIAVNEALTEFANSTEFEGRVVDTVSSNGYATTSQVEQMYKVLIEEDLAEVKIKRVEFSNGAEITVEDNTEYTATEPITNLVITYPETDFICSFNFALAESGNITIDLPESKYIGEIPTFANGETWELNIKNGIVVGGLVE